ncbi:2,3-dihydroxybenzoate-AMP ligase [Pseudarthrobacter phenanthrenivorans]|uniref:2,3-dihydroxybenzoate-AMP ligase n=2 Tax=Pseudarthrobacter phenanthrenivorans TaxID=361575 RepID=A0A3B0FG50_PSEPS|nr:AMP-binding protein [Pseudarthrobacter phenanthrenivorans]ADX75073.1 2,3-dihydroxybenzoate-AMP ligase [Pseudarthrobacter phenanthrenivorans Sphe3]RKO21863.1 2,3-dihydroxybenzoate-AMP ligase [Pseudarthrobacter phenanthrenivorans]
MTSHTSEGTVPWPAELAAEFRRKGYWEDRALGSYVLDTADRFPDKVALVEGDVRITYAELANRMDAAAERLLQLGLKADDRIMLQLPNGWQFTILTLACFRAGIVPVMALPAHRKYELSFLTELSESRAIAVPDAIKDFDHQAMAEELAESIPSLDLILVSGAANPLNIRLNDILAPGTDAAGARARLDASAPSPDAPALFLLSGGTTGLPKLITRTHNDYAYNIKATSLPTAVAEDTVYLGTLPASHNFPLACPGILGILFAGGRVIMLPSPEPRKAFAAIEREGVTLSTAVPAVAQRWIEHQEEVGGNQLASLQVIQVGGSRLPDEIAYKVKPVLGATLQQVFGMAEGLINTTRLDDPEDVICTTQGRPVSEADEIRIVDEAGNDLPDGTAGAILTRGPYTPRGYYRAPEANARAFTPDGWYASGDIVERRPDGNLIVQGRDKDMINRGGEKISAEEIESLVYRIEDITMAAAIAMPDPVLGEKLCLYITVKPGTEVTLEQIQKMLRDTGVAAFKIPERLVVVDELPATKVGKINKKELRADIAERLATASAHSK